MTDREGDWSAPSADVLARIREVRRAGREAVVATVVAVEGSAYRRPGAKMVVDREGGGFGHITAGCLESEVAGLASDVLAAGEPRIERYDLMDDEGDVWGLGVGCNGIIDVLVEPVDERYDPLVSAVEADEPIASLTVLDGDLPLGTRAYYRDGEVEGSVPGWFADGIEGLAARVLEDGGSESVEVAGEAGEATVFVDAVRPDPRLLVVGSGHDVGPVVDLAERNGFHTIVVGFRGGVDLESRFPEASEHVSTSPARIGDDVAPGGYAVVMTHNFVDDRLAVGELLGQLPYVGLMGPPERFEEMRDAFEEEGRQLTEGELESLYTPVGLDLGAGSPYGIATSIVSEILAVHNGREPAHLAEREGPIHDRREAELPGE
ncbi:XdhC family protein [Saliphagus infecundisoli]|uniref:XdhC family protein n=1 Tax=Saliphagus infecundisoli TaxID=1849069 RepID=A0ABD5QGY0_9EURY|nr:XdhC/CoxI family protein [Saliphagus infecundisoli]